MAQQNISLVPQEEIDALNRLNQSLDESTKRLNTYLSATQKVADQLSKGATSFKEITESEEKYQKVLSEISAEEKEQQKILTQIEQVKRKVIQADSDQYKELVRQRQELNKRNQELRNTVKEEQSASGSVEQLRARYERLRREYNSLSVEVRKSDVGKQLKQQLDEAKAYVDSFSTSGNKLKGLLTTLGKGFGIAALIKTITTGIKNASNTIFEFEAANSELKAISGATSEQLKELEMNARNLGSTTRYTASQVTELQTELARLGFSTDEILQSTQAILQFAQATGSGLGDAAALAGNALRAFNASTIETTRYVSAMAVGTTNSALNFGYLQTALSTIAPVANAFGFSIEDVVALLGRLADAGFDASSAATATRNILLNLADDSGALSQVLVELGGEPVRTLEDLMNGLVQLREAGINLNDALELTDKRSVAAFSSFLSGAESVLELKDSVTGAEGELKEIAETMDDNVHGAILNLQSAWEGLVLSFSNSTGTIKSVIDVLTYGLRSFTESIEDVDAQISRVTHQQRERYQEMLTENGTVQEEQKKAFYAYEELVKSGVESAEAEKKAQEETAASYVTALGQKERAIEAYNVKIDELRSRLEGLSFIETWFPKNRKLINELNTAIEVQARWTAEAETTRQIISSINNTPLAPVDNSGLGRESESDRKKREAEAKRAARAAEQERKRQEQERKRQQREAERDAERQQKDNERREKQRIKDEAQLNIYRVQNEAETNRDIYIDQKKSYEERLSALRTYIDQQKQAIRQSADIQLQQEGLTPAAIELINEKAINEQLKLERSFYNESQKITQDYVAEQIRTFEDLRKEATNAINAEELKELEALAKQFSSGNIKRMEDYQRQNADIVQKYSKIRSDAEIKEIEKVLKIANLTADQQSKYAQQIRDLELKAIQEQARAEIRVHERNAQRRIQIERQVQNELRNLNTQTFDLINTIINASYNNRLKTLDKEKEDSTSLYDQQIREVEDLYNSNVISQEQLDAQKNYYAKAQEAREEELEEQRKEILTRQAKFEKKSALAEASIQTALAVTKALPNLILAGVAAALGAVQIATIAAQPLPEYAEGTDNHPGGLAIVGDGGKAELVRTPEGTLFKTPKKDTVVNLPKGTEVFPDYDKAMMDIMTNSTLEMTTGKDILIIKENKAELSLLRSGVRAAREANSIAMNQIQLLSKTSQNVSRLVSNNLVVGGKF